MVRLPAPVPAKMTFDELVRLPPGMEAGPLIVELKLVAVQLGPPDPVQ